MNLHLPSIFFFSFLRSAQFLAINETYALREDELRARSGKKRKKGRQKVEVMYSAGQLRQETGQSALHHKLYTHGYLPRTAKDKRRMDHTYGRLRQEDSPAVAARRASADVLASRPVYGRKSADLEELAKYHREKDACWPDIKAVHFTKERKQWQAQVKVTALSFNGVPSLTVLLLTLANHM